MFPFLISRLRRLGNHARPDRAFVFALERALRARGYLPQKRSWHERWKLAAAGATIGVSLLSATATYAYVSDDVLPDHPLYALRTGLENMETELARTPEQKQLVEFKHLRRRLHEAETQIDKKRPIADAQKRLIRARLDQVTAPSAPQAATGSVAVILNLERRELDDLFEEDDGVFKDSEDADQVHGIITAHLRAMEKHVGSLERGQKDDDPDFSSEE